MWSLQFTGFLGSLAAGLGTGLGALAIFFRPRWGRRDQVVMLAVAAGVMLGATVFSLILPALEIARAGGRSELRAAGVVSGGVTLGALSIWALHACVLHEHFAKGVEGRYTPALGRNWLFILAITLHNFPEGMSVRAAYGAGPETGIAVTVGIGLQNLPEGLAVAAALTADGFGRGRAFWIAFVTGLVEPIGGIVGATVAGISAIMLPWSLAFAAGAMLFVIAGEVIPETHREGSERAATFSLVIGFVAMMTLDLTLG